MGEKMGGPLNKLRILEFAGLGPGPFAAMMLADNGAEIIRISRPNSPHDPNDITLRTRINIELDLKSPAAIEIIKKLVINADAIIEGFRPGVMERLGLGPEILLGINPALVYGRMTGWGQYGPLAKNAGHDINYIAISGALHSFGYEGQKPVPPVNLVGDFGGGGMMLAFGIVSAILHAKDSGQGQVIDCAMTDGSALLMSGMWGFRAEGKWNDERGTNMLDGGAHFYNVYETKDGQYLSVGSIEPQFYATLLNLTQIDDADFKNQMAPEFWSPLKEKLVAIFKSKTRDEWCAIFDNSDACVMPILSMPEAYDHPHNRARQTFLEVDGLRQPAPAPRFSATPAIAPQSRPSRPNSDTVAVLHSLGLAQAEIDAIISGK